MSSDNGSGEGACTEDKMTTSSAMLSSNRSRCCIPTRLRIFVGVVIIFLAGQALLAVSYSAVSRAAPISPAALTLAALSAEERDAPPLELLEVDAAALRGEPLTAVLAVHLHDPERARAALRSWARPRRLQLVPAGGSLSGDASLSPRFVTLHVLLFDASAALDTFDWAAEGVASDTVLHLPSATRAGPRTFAAIAAALARYSDLVWLIKADDDTFLQVGRLLRELLLRNASTPALLGSVLTQWGAYHFTSGGAGYALSRAALDFIMPHAEFCDEPGFGTAEDVMVNVCVDKHAGGRAAIHDLVGLNYHTPEYMLARNEYAVAHLEAAPMSHHYITPFRVTAMMHPRTPLVLLQVWPFDAAPGTAPVGVSAADEAQYAKLAAQARVCSQLAADAGFDYRLEAPYVATSPLIASRRYSAALSAPARELLAGLELLYLNGGARISIWTPCDAVQLSELARLASPPATAQLSLRSASLLRAHNAPPRIVDALPGMHLGAQSGHVFRCLDVSGRACALASATQFNHDVFRATAALMADILQHNASYYDAPQQPADSRLSTQLLDPLYFHSVLDRYHIQYL